MSRGYLTINVNDYETDFAIQGANISIYYIHRNTDDAPNILLSEYPENERPYSRYAIKVTKEGYEDTIISGIQVLPIIEAIQNVKLKKLGNQYGILSSFNIEEHKLYAGYEPKIIEDDSKSTFVLNQVVVPEFIIVHDGLPNDDSAPNYWIYFKDYIKNVASSEIYATWPKSTIYANIVAIISFTLNRVYTEWYRSKGYSFTITSSTAYDHKFINNRNFFDTINIVVDVIFNTYIKRPPTARQPLLAQYCDGQKAQCPNQMTQWGSKDLGDQGKSYEEILRYFYGDEIIFEQAPVVSGVPVSYPNQTLQIGSNNRYVKTIQNQLNAISRSYPAIPKVKEDGIYGESTAESVKTFQRIFGLPQTGVVDFKTWYEISRVYVAVTKIASLNPTI